MGDSQRRKVESSGGVIDHADEIGSALLWCHDNGKGDTRMDALTIFTTYARKLIDGEEDERHWVTFIDTGAIDALMYIMTDKHLCGFTKKELTTWPPDLHTYLNETLVSFSLQIRNDSRSIFL